jgi:hypothetical protein
VPVLPAPSVEPAPDFEPEAEPEGPPPATSRYERVLVAGESVVEFDQFVETVHNHYMPYDYEELVLVAKLVEWRWALQRRKLIFESIESKLYAAEPDPSKWPEDDLKRLMMVDSYRVQAEEAVCRAKKNVEVSMQRRIDDYHFHKTCDIAERRLELQQKKYKLALWSAQMRAKQTAAAGGAEMEPTTKSAVAA